MSDHKETILESKLTNSYKEDLITYMNSHQDSFQELIELSICDKQPYSWRAAWLLWSCMDQNDQRLQGYVKTIIDVLPDRNDSQQRELLMVLERMKIDKKYEGYLFDRCIEIWKNIKKNPSLRFHAFKILITISENYPELLKELKSLSSTHYTSTLTDNVKKSFFKLIAHVGKKLEDNSLNDQRPTTGDR